MIREKRVDDYVNYLIGNNNDNGEILQAIYEQALADNVPIIKPEMEGFLKTLLSICKPKNILELGTAVGYSGSIFLCYDKRCSLVTVEKSEQNAKKAIENFEKQGFTGRYTLYNADILQCEQIKQNKYDFIFVDAAKSSYNEYFDIVKELINDDGIIVFDNILQNGDIAKSKYAVNRRMRTIHTRMKKFMSRVLYDDNFNSTLMTISDGVILCRKKCKDDNLKR